jgi:hypothetical protein
MESEFSGHVRRAMERLLQQMEGLERRQEALEALTQRIMAEQEELRRRQEVQSQEWQNFGRRWSAHSAAWKAQMQQLKGFTRQLTALLPRCRRRNEAGEGGGRRNNPGSRRRRAGRCPGRTYPGGRRLLKKITFTPGPASLPVSLLTRRTGCSAFLLEFGFPRRPCFYRHSDGPESGFSMENQPPGKKKKNG